MVPERLEEEACLPAAFVPSLNGARMPSIAEDVATDRRTLLSRAAGLRRYRLVSERRELMAQVYQLIGQMELGRK